MTIASFGQSELLIAMVQAFGAPRPTSNGLSELYEDLVQAIKGSAAGSATFINVVTQFGADPTGATDSTAAFTSALQAAFNSANPFVTVYVPVGKYLVGGVVKPFTSAPGSQTQIIYLTGAGIGDTVIQAPWMNTHDLFYFIGCSVVVSGITFDNNAGTGNTIIFLNQYVNQHTLQGCSATAGTLTITLGSNLGAGVLGPGTQVCLQNTSAFTNSVPFAGTVASYNVGGGGAGVDTITVNPNGIYPTINTTIGPTPMTYGTGVCVVPRCEVRDCSFRNRGASWASVTLTGVTGGSGTFTWAGLQFTLNYGMTAVQINNAINAVLNAATPLGFYSRLNVMMTPTGATLGQPGSVLYMLGLSQGNTVAFAAGGNNFTGGTAAIANQSSGVGRDVLVNDTSNQWPSNLLEYAAENVLFENETGDIQEVQGIVNVRRAYLRRQRYINTFASRGTIAAGSTTLMMDGLLPAPPPAGIVIGVQNAGAAYGAVTSQTATTNLYLPNVLTMSGTSLSPADLAALTPGCTISIPGAGPSGATLVTPMTYIWTTAGKTYIWILNPVSTAVSGVTITQTASHLMTTVAQPGSTTVTNALGTQVTQIPLTLPAAQGVSESFVGTGGGRAVFDMYAVDRGTADDIKSVVGIYGMTTYVNLGWNYGAMAIHDINRFAIDDPFNTAAYGAQMNIDSQRLRASQWDIPATVRIALARWHPGGQRMEFVDCDLRGGVQINNTAAWTRLSGGTMGMGVSSNVAVISQNGGLGDSGPIFITGTDVNAGTGMVCGCSINTSSNAFDLRWNGGSCTRGQYFAGSFGGATARVTFDPTTAIRNVNGINPVGANPIAAQLTPFTLPASGSAWTNNSGSDVQLSVTTGSFTAAQVNGVAQNPAGPWRVQVGGTFAVTYTTAPTVTAMYE